MTLALPLPTLFTFLRSLTDKASLEAPNSYDLEFQSLTFSAANIICDPASAVCHAQLSGTGLVFTTKGIQAFAEPEDRCQAGG
jgi:hypothetical protein